MRSWQLTPQMKWLLPLAMSGLYVLAFLALYPRLGSASAMLVALPVVGTASLLGLNAGVAAWLLAFPLQIILFSLHGRPAWDMLLQPDHWVCMGVLLALTVGVGWQQQSLRESRRDRPPRLPTTPVPAPTKLAEAAEPEKFQVTLAKEQELSALKTRMMASLSHEFRTPLASILASSELLERYFDRLPPHRQVEAFATIRAQVLRLKTMLDELSEVVLIESAEKGFHPGPIDLAALCRDVIEQIAPMETGARISLTVEGALAAVSLDAELVKPIVHNLLHNAVKYSPAGGSVHLTIARRDDTVEIRVADQGIGIAPEDRARIFEPLFRGGNVGTINGLGLGLTLVQHYVLLHGGTIEVASHVGQGSTFTVQLPTAA